MPVGPVRPGEKVAVATPVGVHTTLRELFAPFYRMRTLVVWSIWGLSFFVTQALNSWLPTIYRQELHLSVQASLEFTLEPEVFRPQHLTERLAVGGTLQEGVFERDE